MKLRISSDQIQFGILMVTGICMLGGFWAYCEAHFARADTVNNEIIERRSITQEMKMEIDAIYVKQIPEPERKVRISAQ